MQTEAQLQSYKENGFEEYEYMACHNRDVCANCKALDGKIFKIDDGCHGENAPPCILLVIVQLQLIWI